MKPLTTDSTEGHGKWDNTRLWLDPRWLIGFAAEAEVKVNQILPSVAIRSVSIRAFRG